MKLDETFTDFNIEDKTFECKARLDREKILGWLKTVDGFANNKGGILFLGVEDKTYKLIGFDSAGVDKEKNYFYSQINQHFDVKPIINLHLIPYVINDSKRYIIKIDILESEIKPVILKYQEMPMIFM